MRTASTIRLRRLVRISIPAGLALAAAAVLPAADAQYSLNQDGRLLDANPSLSGRYNMSRPVSPLMRGNQSATGNLRFGQSLRSFSPIDDPTAFRAGLGSTYFSNYLRDSVSAGDRFYRSEEPYAQPFYDPSGTAPTGAFLRQVGSYHSAMPTYGADRSAVHSQTLPGQLNYSGPMNLRIDPRAARVWQPSDFDAPEAPELSSSIFGLPRAPLPGPVSFDVPEIDTRADSSPFALPRGPMGLSADREQATSEGWDFRLPTSRLEPVRPLATVVSGDSTDLLGRRALQYTSADSRVGGPDEPGASNAPALTLGSDLFTDLQMAIELEENPQAEWFKDLHVAFSEDATAAQEIQADAAERGEEFLKRVLDTPLRTLVGKAESPLNDELSAAEVMMAQGRFMDAAGHYDRACQADPSNPLPLVGKGHALLAAGQYRSAINFLIRGIERFPELSRFEVDLEALLGGGETVDIRRSELMKLLEQNEDQRLRFLLGYLEIHSGNRESGMRNLDQAAEGADVGTLIRRYPGLLRGEGLLPPAKLPPPDSPELDDSE